MSRPIERYTQLLDQIISGYDLSHDFGRKKAHEAAIEYARKQLMDDPHRDDFLREAARRLGFAPASFDTIESRVKPGGGARLDVWISDEDDEIALTGTSEGLQYLIDLLTQLRDASDLDEHVHLDRGLGPMTETSANLVLFKEDETWFTGSEEAIEPYPVRDVKPEGIYAIQFLQYPPEGVPISVQRLYRVVSVEPAPEDATNVKEFPEGTPGRYRMFTFLGEGGQRFTYGFHLDDPSVVYFSHRDIVSLVMRQA